MWQLTDLILAGRCWPIMVWCSLPKQQTKLAWLPCKRETARSVFNSQHLCVLALVWTFVDNNLLLNNHIKPTYSVFLTDSWNISDRYVTTVNKYWFTQYFCWWFAGTAKVKRKVPTTVVPGDYIVPITVSYKIISREHTAGSHNFTTT